MHQEVASQPAPSGGYVARCLQVLSVVLERERVTPKEICEVTGFGRTVVHRSIHTLIDQGYARYQLGHRYVTPTSYILNVASRRTFLHRYPERICDVVGPIAKAFRLRVDVAIVTVSGAFQLFESTHDGDWEEDADPLFSDLFVAALTQFTRREALVIATEVIRRNRSG